MGQGNAASVGIDENGNDTFDEGEFAFYVTSERAIPDVEGLPALIATQEARRYMPAGGFPPLLVPLSYRRAPENYGRSLRRIGAPDSVRIK